MDFVEQCVESMGEKMNACALLEVKPEGKRPLGRSRRRRLHNIKMNTGNIGWDGMGWSCLVQDRDKFKAI
jgi:hypothetical protein